MDKFILALIITFSCVAVFAETALEVTAAGSYRKYKDGDQTEEMGLGIRGRYTKFSSNGNGWFLRAHFDEHLMAPVLIPGLAKRWGRETFFELGAGAYIGTLVKRNITLAASLTVGHQLGSRFFVTLPFYYDLNMASPFLAEFTPFIGYTF